MQWISHTHTGLGFPHEQHQLGSVVIEWKHHAIILGFCVFQCHIAISETVRWKNIIPVSYCRAAQELLNGVWIMGIHPRELNCATFCMRPFLWVLASSMHKSAYHGARKCLWDIGLQQAESKRVTLSYLESKEWPEKTAKNWNVALDTLPGSACLGRLGWTYPYTITKKTQLIVLWEN